MHTIIPELCTGCDLCVPPCPVDCIEMVPVTGDSTGWDAWSPEQAAAARGRHDRRLARQAREREAAEARTAALRAAKATDGPDAADAANAQPAATANDPAKPDDDPAARKRTIIQAAMERARRKKVELAQLGAGPRNTDAVTPEVQAQIDAAEARRRRLGLNPDPPPKSADAANPARPAKPDPDAT
jgi:electron transport complex protein RnfB